MKTCLDCPADISHKANQAKRCDVCLVLAKITNRSSYMKRNPHIGRKATDKHRLNKKYGLSRADIKSMLDRQFGRCLGCQNELVKPCVDHCHNTGKVRGLLCNVCNVALGMVRENPATLRRLMAYLDRDPDKILIYLIGALKNPRVPEVAIELRKHGFDVMDEWYTPGPHADENWQKYEAQRGRTYAEALRGRAATNIFLFDRSYLDMADRVVMVMPAGKSAMIELGYAKGKGKPGYILLDGNEPERYDIMPGVADGVCNNVNELLEVL